MGTYPFDGDDVACAVNGSCPDHPVLVGRPSVRQIAVRIELSCGVDVRLPRQLPDGLWIGLGAHQQRREAVAQMVNAEAIASASHQAWLFYFPLAPPAALPKDDWLDPVDQLTPQRSSGGNIGLASLGRSL